MKENSDIFQEIFTASLEAVSDSAEKVKEVVDNLVKESKSKEGNGNEFVDGAIQKGTELGKEIEDKITEIITEQLKKISLVSHPDFQKIISEISKLKDKVAKLEEDKNEKQE